MITQDEHCFRDDLIRLIETRLPADQEQKLTQHLDSCDQCQSQLDELAGSADLWREANDVLSTCDKTLSHKTSGQLDSTFSPNRSTGWVRSLLTPSQRPELLGELNDRDVYEVIGQGGMGVVLKVWDSKLHRFLAAKMLSPMLASNGIARQRFFREAQSAAAVVHPNIVPIYDIQTDHSVPYILMPLVDGGSLQQRIERDGPLPLVEVLAIGLQVAEALVAAHAQGLIHRDIKPANILLDSGGRRVLLSDFGLARTLDEASMTASGIISGTPHYMSPEQARGETLDPRSDLFSLGSVLFAMATGHPPVRGSSPLEVLRQVSEKPLVPASEINETLPLWFDQLLNQFLNKEADQRLKSATEASELLRGCLAHLRAPARTELPAVVAPPVISGSSRGVPIWLFISLLVMLTGIVAGLFAGSQLPKPERNSISNATSQPSIEAETADGSVSKPSAQRSPASHRESKLDSGSALPSTTNRSIFEQQSVDELLDLESQLDRQIFEIEDQLNRLNSQLAPSASQDSPLDSATALPTLTKPKETSNE